MLHFGMNMPFYLMAFYGSIMIIMVLLLRVFLKNRLPKFVFPVLWGLVLLRFLIPFSISSPMSMPVPANPYGADMDEATSVSIVQEDADIPETAILPGTMSVLQEAVSTTDVVSTYAKRITPDYGSSAGLFFRYIDWKMIVLSAYILVLFVTAGILGWQKHGYNRKLRNGLLVEHNETVNAILRNIDMGHVLVFTNDEIASPLVCGLLNPRIYLPTQMDFQNTVLLRHVLMHEAMHIRRRDNWMKGILLPVLCLNWYNPLVWLMAVCLVSDLEAACDAAVLKTCGEEERKDYASSLLAMALSGKRTTLLYSAFSKTEVEKRVKNILHYKKATVLVLLFTVLFMAGSMMAFAAVGQAPFSEYLTSFCGSSSSRWGVKVTLARDIALGEKAQERAEGLVFSILRMDSTDNPGIIEDKIRTALAEEFGVEKGAFHVMLQLCLSKEELEEEYAAWGITRAKDGSWMYQEEQVRIYEDKMLGSYQSREGGTVDISVQRDALGMITSVTVRRQGDLEYDRHTAGTEEYGWYRYQNGTDIMEEYVYKLLPTDDVKPGDDLAGGYEYYLTKEELITDIERGYIFKLDTTLKEHMTPYVTQGNWPFYVHEDNTVNLKVAFSNLFARSNKNIFPEGERIIVEVFSPDGQSVYRFERTGDEITEDTSIQEQIAVTPGEWNLQVSFAYICRGGNTPAHLEIAAAYENPSQEDINWLKEERVNRQE